jgi:hypothetical protein
MNSSLTTNGTRSVHEKFMNYHYGFGPHFLRNIHELFIIFSFWESEMDLSFSWTVHEKLSMKGSWDVHAPCSWKHPKKLLTELMNCSWIIHLQQMALGQFMRTSWTENSWLDFVLRFVLENSWIFQEIFMNYQCQFDSWKFKFQMQKWYSD